MTTRTPSRRFDYVATARFADDALITQDAIAGGDLLTLSVPVALPWGVEVVANLFGDRVVFDPGSVEVDDPGRVKFLLDHRPDKPFGYGVAFTDTAAGLSGVVAIPRDELADPEVAGAVRQMGNGVRDAVSVGVDFVDTTEEPRDDGSFLITVHAARLLEVSTVTIPRFDDARHDPLAAASPPERTRTMSLAATATMSPTDPSPPQNPDPDDPNDPDNLFARLGAHTATLAALAGNGVAVTHEPHPLARFHTLFEYGFARREDPVHVPDLAAVWVDQITTNNPGVMQPGWLATIVGILDVGRPFISALGGPASAGASGMTLNYPYYDGDLTTLVGVQAAEKTEITSVRVDIKTASTTLETYAGGSDLSYQLLTRSSPSYQDAYTRILASAYAITTDTAAGAGAVAGSTDYVIVPLLTATPAQIASALFAASSKVQRATGSPATVVAAADDVYAAIAGAVFQMGSSPTGNVAGASASASGLSVNLAGFSVVNVPTFPDGTAIVTNRQAGVWHEDGPRTAMAEDVPRLGRDVAIWGLGTWTTFTGAGIVELVATAPVATRGSESKAK